MQPKQLMGVTKVVQPMQLMEVTKVLQPKQLMELTKMVQPKQLMEVREGGTTDGAEEGGITKTADGDEAANTPSIAEISLYVYFLYYICIVQSSNTDVFQYTRLPLTTQNKKIGPLIALLGMRRNISL
jgi:hypothetical protein